MDSTEPRPGGAPAGDVSRADAMGEEARRIGHDLNNCLGIVGGRAELVLMYLDSGKTDGARQGVQVILDQMERMKGLSDEIRNLRHRT
jgi:nitrogen-specific signal transduction histidine kinase